MNKLIIYELNELPKKILNYYVDLRPHSTLAKLKKDHLYRNTFSHDIGELHPWSTWPTFYRGVNNELHKINFINQDKSFADENYPSVWNILIKHAISIGIFGSLQSYPPVKNENVDFYLPDTFAPDFKAFPESLSSFQKFNLAIVGNNNATARKLRIVDIKNFLKCFLDGTIDPKTLIYIAMHLSKELISPKYKNRRALIQPIIGFDPYFKLLKEYQPRFTTFFTNHLAGQLHRFWYDLFPNDFGRVVRDRSNFKKESIIKALDIADHQLKKLIIFARNNNYNLWVASSMGQGAIDRGGYKKEIFLKEPYKLLKCLNLNIDEYKFLPAMYPDINIKCKDDSATKKICSKLEKLCDKSNNQIIKLRYLPSLNTVNLCINNISINESEKNIFFNKIKFNLDETGFEFFERDEGTGYHIPEGILLAYGDASKNIFNDYHKLDTRLLAPLILKFFEIEKTNYMLEV